MKIGIFLGRFQDITKSHEYIIKKAAKSCDKLIIVIVDAGKINKDNPFSYYTRECFIKRVIKDYDNVSIVSFKNGYIPDMLEYLKTIFTISNNDEIIIHCGRDRTVGYAKQLPYNIVLRSYTREDDISATNLRKALREDDY